VLEHLARITEAGINPLAPGGIFATVHARLDAAGHYLDLIDIMVHDFCDHFGGYMSDSLDYILRAPWLHAFLMDDRYAQPAAKALVPFYSPARRQGLRQRRGPDGVPHELHAVRGAREAGRDGRAQHVNRSPLLRF